MKTETNKLIGLTLTSVNVSKECLRLDFDADTHLVIFNTWCIHSNSSSKKNIELLEISNCIGLRVKNITSTVDSICIDLDSDISIRVDLNNVAWNGPEAAVLYFHNSPSVVWS